MQLETSTANFYCSAGEYNSNIRGKFLKFAGAYFGFLEASLSVLMCDKFRISHKVEKLSNITCLIFTFCVVADPEIGSV